MSDTETDNTDEPTKAELHDRVEKLESTVAKMMPSRRDALKLGAAGIAGAAGLSAASQSADASTGSAGEIGDPNNRPDLISDEIDTNSLETDSFSNSNLSVGSQNILQSFPVGGERQSTLEQFTENVGTTTTGILDFNIGQGSACLIFVAGGTSNRDFCDLVLAEGFAPPTVVASVSRSASPNRSYGVNGRVLEVTLSSTGGMPGGTTDISAFGVGLQARDL